MKELSDIFQKNSQYAQKGLLTVTDVKVSPDLSLARIYLSFIGVKDSLKAVENIENSHGAIRGELGNNLRNSLRKIPELQFYLDDTAEYAQKINKIMDGLHIPPSKEDDNKE